MKLLAIAVAFLAVAATKKKDAAPADPNQELARAYGAKVWATGPDQPAPSSSGPELKTWLSSRPAGSEVARKGKDGPWSITYLAIFKKPAAKGPVTVQFVDKTDPKIIVDQYSPENNVATLVYRGSYDLDPDLGFNKGHTYVMKVGQIIKGKFQPYAAGHLTLK